MSRLLVPRGIGEEFDKELYLKRAAFESGYKAFGIDHFQVIEMIDLGNPWVLQNEFFYESPVTLRYQIANKTKLLGVPSSARQDPEDLELTVVARITKNYFEGKKRSAQYNKLARKISLTKLDAAKQILEMFPDFLKALDGEGKSVVGFIPPDHSGNDASPGGSGKTARL